MKRNMKVKNNVDDLLMQIMDYMHKSGISEREFDTLCLEMASTCIAVSIAFDPDDYENERQRVIEEVGKKIIFLSTEIIEGIDKAVENNDIKAQYDIRGE